MEQHETEMCYSLELRNRDFKQLRQHETPPPSLQFLNSLFIKIILMQIALWYY